MAGNYMWDFIHGRTIEDSNAFASATGAAAAFIDFLGPTACYTGPETD